MKLQLLLCLAGGALIAGLRPASSSAEPGDEGSCCSALAVERTSCSVDPEVLGLSDEQCQQLESLCRTECMQVDDVEAQAAAALETFYERLADADATPDELHALADEASAQRAQALTALVDAIVEVRAVLEPEQLAQLVGGCCRQSE